MTNEEILTPGTSNTMMSNEAQAKVQEIHDSNLESNQENVAQSNEQVSSQVVPKDEQSIVLGLIEYLKRGAEFSAENKDQAEWFLFCSEWVKSAYEKSGLSR